MRLLSQGKNNFRKDVKKGYVKLAYPLIFIYNFELH